jgi:hypothetical protein
MFHFELIFGGKPDAVISENLKTKIRLTIHDSKPPLACNFESVLTG